MSDADHDKITQQFTGDQGQGQDLHAALKTTTIHRRLGPGWKPLREAADLAWQLQQCSKTMHIRGLRVQQNDSYPKIMDEKKISFSRSFEDAKEKENEISFLSLMGRVETVTGGRSGSKILLPEVALFFLFVSLSSLSTAALVLFLVLRGREGNVLRVDLPLLLKGDFLIVLLCGQEGDLLLRVLQR